MHPSSTVPAPVAARPATTPLAAIAPAPARSAAARADGPRAATARHDATRTAAARADGPRAATARHDATRAPAASVGAAAAAGATRPAASPGSPASAGAACAPSRRAGVSGPDALAPAWAALAPAWAGLAGALLALAAVAPGALAAGCNEAQPPVNRVQPGALRKAEFLGDTFYMLQTVIDTPYSVGFTFVGEQSELEKIRWEITENFLIARRSYEWIAGSEDGAITGSASERTAPVAIFRIQSHFDIQRQYNVTTGEEWNVVEENTTDRPWYDRQYFRVDWSRNLAESNDFLALGRLFEGVTVESVAYEVPFGRNHPNAPKFVDQDGDGRFDYMDIVQKSFVTPSQVEIEGWGTIPSCFLYFQDHLDCTSAEITVRNSFLKVDPARDYQPMLYTGDRMERFGYFVTARPGYDPQYGVVEAARHRFVNRHNLWRQSHRRGADGALVACRADADCADGRGSVCDLDLARALRRREGACTIPYRDRAVRPVVYHLSHGFPEDLEPDAEHVAAEWNAAFAETVASARETECLRNGGDAAACAAERARPDGREVFVLCHSPVRASDPEACGARGTVAPIGDLRYSMMAWVGEPHLSSPLGYGPSAADPETGEIVQANAFVYGAGVETLASFARDIVALLDGEVTVSAITSGQNVRSWVERMTSAGAEATGRTADDHVIALDGADVHAVERAMAMSERLRPALADPGARRPRRPGELLERARLSRDRLARAGVLGRDDRAGQARLAGLHGTDVEYRLATRDLLAAAGVDPRLPVDARTGALASPLRGALSGARRRALERARRRLDRHGCVLRADFADEGLLGLARAIRRAVDDGTGTLTWYGRDYPVVGPDGRLDQTAVRAMLRHPIFDAVTAHEVGHTVGLRHNFSGSYDAINYRPEYWALRDDGTMRPRAWDPITEAELNGRIREYQYATVMDYGNNFVVTDAAGLGHYDRAAIKMGYADLVEVFDGVPDPTEMVWYDVFSRYGWPVTLTWDAVTGGRLSAYTYTDLPRLVGGVAGLERRADVPYASLRADAALRREGFTERVVDERGRPVVPYLFCSDEQADLGPDCMLYDAGADPYETLQNVIDTYWNYYIFSAFRRERVGFDVDSYLWRVYDRYFTKLQYANQIYALYRPILEDVFSEGGTFDETFWTREDGMGAWTLGVGATFALFARVLAAPEPGVFAPGERPDGTAALLPAESASVFGRVVVDTLDGRYLDTSWNFDAGYYWFDQLERAGYFYDKLLAMQVLTDPETHFIGRDTSTDLRQYQLNYYTTFAPALTGLVRGILSDDWTAFAPRARGGRLAYPTLDELVRGDAEGAPLDPNASFSLQLYTSVLAMTLIPQTFDQTFLDDARLWVRGGAESVEVSGPTVTFTDPSSGYTYVARSRVVDGVEQGVGARMLRHAQRLADRGRRAELARFVDNLNVVRRLSWDLGFGG